MACTVHRNLEERTEEYDTLSSKERLDLEYKTESLYRRRRMSDGLTYWKSVPALPRALRNNAPHSFLPNGCRQSE